MKLNLSIPNVSFSLQFTYSAYVYHAAGLWPAMYIAEHIRKCHTHGLT